MAQIIEFSKRCRQDLNLARLWRNAWLAAVAASPVIRKQPGVTLSHEEERTLENFNAAVSMLRKTCELKGVATPDLSLVSFSRLLRPLEQLGGSHDVD